MTLSTSTILNLLLNPGLAELQARVWNPLDLLLTPAEQASVPLFFFPKRAFRAGSSGSGTPFRSVVTGLWRPLPLPVEHANAAPRR